MNSSEYNNLIKKIDFFAKKNTKESRYQHTLRVAQTCVDICKRYGLDEKKGYIAGLAHDICKDFSKEEMLDLARKDGEVISDFEMKNIKLLHGRAAATLLKEEFNVKDGDVLEAVAQHTSGHGLSDIAKVLFLADKIEPNRPQSTDEYRENLFKLSFNQMFLSVFKENYDFVLGKGYSVYPNTKKMLEYFESICDW